MATLPRSYTSRDILPSEATMARDGYQDCALRKTTGRRPKWYCRYAVDVITGPGKTRRVERRKYFGLCAEMTERQAKRERDEFRRVVNAPRQRKLESQVPMDAWLNDYENTFIPTLKPNSQRVYLQATRLIRDRFGTMRLCNVTQERVQGWINELAVTCGSSRLNLVRSVLRSVFEIAVDYGRFDARNPAERVRMPQGRISRADLRALTPDEIRRLLAVCDCTTVQGVSLGDVARVGLFCGLRVGEMLALEWRDVRGRELYVERSKAQYSDDMTAPKSTAGRRVVPMGPVVLKRPETAAATDRVFPLEYRHVYRNLKAAFRTAGVKIEGTVCHALRRTYATYTDAAGATALREAMGHATDAMSFHYVRRGFADQELAAMRMAELIIGEGRKQ